MIKMMVRYLNPGTFLSHPIKSEEGRILFAGGKELSSDDIQKIIDQNFVVVYVDQNDLILLRGKTALERDRVISSLQYRTPLLIDEPHLISENIQIAAVEAVHNIVDDIWQGRSVDAGEAREVVEAMVSEIVANRQTMVNLIDISNLDDYTFSHSVNVCVLSILTGMEMELSDNAIRELGLGALLHDIGKLNISKDILNKKGPLTEEEFSKVQQHTIFGRDMLRQDESVNKLIFNIAHQHHEKISGNGYPQHLSKKNIDIFARIVSVADVYDALTTNRCYRAKVEPYKAMKTILSGNSIHFDPQIVEMFVRLMSVYPVESVVRLSSGEVAVVIRASRRSHIAPVVRLLFDKDGIKITSREEVDLSKDARYISGVALEASAI